MIRPISIVLFLVFLLWTLHHYFLQEYSYDLEHSA